MNPSQFSTPRSLVARVCSTVLFVTTFLFASHVLAQPGENENIWYGGFSWTSFKSEQIPERDLENRHDSFFFARRVTNGTSYGTRRVDFDDSQNGFKGFVGVSPNDSWDWELGFINFADVSGTFTAGQINAPVGSSVLTSVGELKGIYWHVQYRFDLEPATYIKGLELVPRLGLWGWDSQITSTYQTDDPSIETRTLVDNNKGWDEFYGLGLSYEITPGFHIRAEAERFIFDSTEADVVSVGLDFIVPKIPYLFF